ncbi:general transcription factor IIF subunit 2-like [Myotis myotis]|uniref:general transcription factor IIF subunit 2-like n=1 Tax=Myotis myotis TaxID=51298 RepID=UPI00174D2F90|nr:general transcription factor IIF subunit 2-like [Myotis myotis]
MWLVKVPRYLSQPWSGASGSGQVGKLQMARNPGKSELFFTLHEGLTRAPGEHPVLLRAERAGPRGAGLGCTPAAGERSWRRKRTRRERSRPRSLARTVQVPPRARHHQLQTCRQPSAHMEYEKKKKESGKQVRADKDQGLALLFAAFEEHQCYCMKDLVGVALQLYPKGFLHEVAVRVAQGPHGSAWNWGTTSLLLMPAMSCKSMFEFAFLSMMQEAICG